MRVSVFSCVTALLWCVSGFSQEEGDSDPNRSAIRRFRIVRAHSPIEVDGHLTEPAWKHATLIDLPFEWYPGENIEPPVDTECLVTYDARYLYVGFRACDPEPGSIRAHLMDRDQIETLVQDDYVGFMLDTFNDERRAYQLRVNPLGVQADAFNFSSSEDWQWDMIWESAGRIQADGYSVEVAVPFHQLRFPASGGELTFGFAAMRSWPRNVRHRMQSFHLDFSDACWMCQFNKLCGFDGLLRGYNLEVDPTLTSSRTDARDEIPFGERQRGAVEIEPGITVRWGITPNLTLNGTVNPDFSQVEADVAQLEVNERYALFFPEKRPFFLEGSDFFHTPRRVVFTRTVADPVWGTKLTGKIGVNALGVFVARDRINNLVIPSNQSSTMDSLEQEVTGSVLRYRRDVGRSSSVGVIYTGREASDYHNRVAALDGLIQVADSDTLQLQYLHSNTLYPEEVAERHDQSFGALAGRGLFVEYMHGTRRWNWAATYQDLTPGFRADSGFIPRVDVRQGEAWISHTWWGDRDDWWSSVSVGPGYSRTEDHNRTLTNETLGVEVQFQGPWQSDMLVSLTTNKEYFNGRTFNLDKATVSFDVQPSSSIKVKVEGDFGGEIDSFNTRKGELFNLRPGVELKLGRHVNLDLNHSYQRLDVEGGVLFRENLTEARIFYHFDVRKLLRLIAQYRSIDQDPALFAEPVEPEIRRLFLQLLASYKLNPRTVVFVGYSDNYLGLPDTALVQSERTFFAKVGYAWSR